MATELIIGNWTYEPQIATIWCDDPGSNYDPYTPNVIRNLKDKPQPTRDERHYAPGTYATGGVIDPRRFETYVALPNCEADLLSDEEYFRATGLRRGYPIAILSR